MIVLKLGWQHLRPLEKIALVAATFIGIGLACVAVLNGSGLISNQIIGPLVLMAFVWQSTLMTGIMRMRSKAMNHMFVEAIKALNAARLRLGEEIPKGIKDMIAKFLGDTK